MIFAIQLVLILILVLFKKFSSKWIYIPIVLLAIGVGIYGAYYTFQDFTTTSHKHMKIYFHAGGYLFWANWLISCVFIMLIKKQQTTDVIESIDSQFTIPKASIEIIKESNTSTNS